MNRFNLTEVSYPTSPMFAATLSNTTYWNGRGMKIEDGLSGTLRDIGAGLCRESWTKSYDFEVEDEGTIFILTPTSDAGLNWCWEHLPEDAQRWGKFGYVIEHRYIQDIVAGMERDDLERGA